VSMHLCVHLPQLAGRMAKCSNSCDSNLQSRQQGGRGVGGRGLRDSSGGAWARQRLIVSWLWSAERVRGALKVLAERSAQLSLSRRGSYKASGMRVPALSFERCRSSA
jgi:hypothetical protein